MPKLRRFDGMEMPAADENTTFPCRLISPDFGASRPAMERSVVVFPQPLGPSSVKSFPSGTSNETSSVARTAWPRSPGYSVHSDSTISTTWSVSRVSLTYGVIGRRVARVERKRNPGPSYPYGNAAPGFRWRSARATFAAPTSDSWARNAEPPGGKSLEQDEAQQRRHQHHAERRKLHIL